MSGPILTRLPVCNMLFLLSLGQCPRSSTDCCLSRLSRQNKLLRGESALALLSAPQHLAVYDSCCSATRSAQITTISTSWRRVCSFPFLTRLRSSSNSVRQGDRTFPQWDRLWLMTWTCETSKASESKMAVNDSASSLNNVAPFRSI